MFKCYLPVEATFYKKGDEDGYLLVCKGNENCQYRDDGYCLDKPDTYSCDKAVLMPYVYLTNENRTVFLKEGDVLVTSLFGKHVFSREQYEKLFIESPCTPCLAVLASSLKAGGMTEGEALKYFESLTADESIHVSDGDVKSVLSSVFIDGGGSTEGV